MSLVLQAPVPNLQTTCQFPSPQFSDSEAIRQSMQPVYAMDGTLYTYVKSNTRSKLNYSLKLTRMKALELRAFIQAYYRATIRLTNHKGEVWNVQFTSNPFDFAAAERAGGQPGGELTQITLEFEGTKVA